MRSSLLLVLFVLALCPGWLHAQCSVSVTGGVLTCAQQSVTLQITTSPQGLSWECFGPQGQLYVSPNNPVVNVPGAYTVTVTDGLGCTNTATAEVTLNAVFATLNGSTVNVSCNGAADGAINLVVVGASSPYTLDWSDLPGTNNPEDRTGLTAGVYTVTVTGNNGCETSATFTVTQPVPLIVTTQAQNTTCSPNSGVITAAVSGGLQPYVYEWSNGTTTPTIGNLSAGNYCLTVTDANGCTTTTCTDVQAAGLDISSVVVKSDCPGATGSIDLSVSGGTGPYLFNWSDLPGASDPEDRTNLASGTYVVTVSDEVGCTAVRSRVVGNNTTWTVSLAITNVSCFGGSDGAIGVTVSGASGPFTFDWAHISSGSNNQEDLTNLTAGTYVVTVTDASGCFNTASATVTQPTQINIAAVTTPTTACLGPSGAIDITVTGGTAPYTYDWSDIAGTSNTQDRTGLVAGTYCVTVTDINGCTAVRCVTVVQSAGIIVTATVEYLNCATTVQLVPTVSGGTGPYTYAWSGPAGYSNTTMSPLANSLGNYCVVVTDVTNGCTGTACVTVVPFLASASATPADCSGENTGVATVTVSGGVAPYLFDWSNGANTQTISDLAPGTYCVTVTDETNCFTTTCVIVEQQPGVSLQATTCSNEINGVVTGGTPVGGYTVVWTFNGAPQGIDITNGAFTISGAPGEYTIVASDVNNCQATATVVIAPNPTPCTFISGTIKLDGNDNCTADPTELGASNWLVRAIGPSGTFYAFTDATGAYLIRVEPGTYTVTIDPLTLGSAQLCAPESYNVTLANAGDTASGNDFVAEEAPICPELTVSLNTSLLRRCFGSSYWGVWTNSGLATAEDAYVLVELDPFLVFSSASLPFTNLGNNVYRLELGDVPPGGSGVFNIWVTVSCDAVLGQTHCSTATIFPNGPCEPPSPEWSGAEVDVRSECVSDSLHFILKNVGNGPMSSTLNYIVIEDGIMTRMGQTAPLAALDSMVVSVPANGSTWRVEADQEAFFPGFNLPVLSVEGCSNTGSFTTGWVQQFTSGVFAPWESINCTNNIGSYDPNDKQGFPLGYGPEHYIRPGTPIDYLIRFQNTGTDTAFNIVIRDTLSAFLDPATVRVGASSHPYEFNFGGENVLVFDFKNILLPDSNVNLAGSQGFVQFQISPRASAPLESVIENQAAIYFDFNKPIFTNTTNHRLGENFVAVSLWDPRQPRYQVRVSPNPLRSEARLEVLGVPENTAPSYRLQVFDLTGRLVQEMTGGTPQFLLQKNTLDAGAYLFKVLTADSQVLGNGRLLVTE